MKDDVGKKKTEYVDLKIRTKNFALLIIRFYSGLSKTAVMQVLGNQILRSGTSVGAHYREGIRARSNAEFISKIEGGLQELEETSYWLELFAESKECDLNEVNKIQNEADELTSIFVTCVKNAKNRNRK